MWKTDKFKSLPDEILLFIIHYLPYKTRLLLNKTHYNSYHRMIIPKCLNYLNINYDVYIKNIFINDYEFIFNQLLNDNVEKWIFIKNYRIIGMKFKNYLYFLLYYSKENKANKCYKLIHDLIYNTGLNVKQHKNKIINRDIIWTK